MTFSTSAAWAETRGEKSCAACSEAAATVRLTDGARDWSDQHFGRHRFLQRELSAEMPPISPCIENFFKRLRAHKISCIEILYTCYRTPSKSRKLQAKRPIFEFFAEKRENYGIFPDQPVRFHNPHVTMQRSKKSQPRDERTRVAIKFVDVCAGAQAEQQAHKTIKRTAGSRKVL